MDVMAFLRGVAGAWAVALAVGACSVANAPKDAIPTDSFSQVPGAVPHCPEGTEVCEHACIDLKKNRLNCGACGQACSADKECVMSKCQTVCGGTSVLCGAKCVDVKDDPLNCGDCNKTCPSPANAVAFCGGGMCQSQCQPLFKDCDGKPDTGCETNVTMDPSNCGACGAPCPAMAANAAPKCDAGSCTPNCTMGFGDCDSDLTNGCEATFVSDANNCGMCGKKCADPTPNCVNGTCTKLYWVSGVQQNVAESALAGWTKCYTDNYAVGINPPAVVLPMCTKNRLLMACRPNGAQNFALVAMGMRSDVLFDCGSNPSCTHVANGVGWYYSPTYSWGYVNNNDPVQRNSCDVAPGPLRLCWHTGGSSGFRCGDTFLNGNPSWERDVYQAD